MEVKNEWEASNVIHYRKRHAAFLESLRQRRLGVDATERSQSGGIDANSSDAKRIRIPLVIKADVDGSVQAIEQQIEGLNADLHNAQFEIVTANVGDVSQGDVETARDCKGILLLFNAKLNRRFFPFLFLVDAMQKLVHNLKIATVSDSIIYSLLDDVPIFGIPKIQLKSKASEFMPIVNAPVTVATADVLKADFWNSR